MKGAVVSWQRTRNATRPVVAAANRASSHQNGSRLVAPAPSQSKNWRASKPGTVSSMISSTIDSAFGPHSQGRKAIIRLRNRQAGQPPPMGSAGTLILVEAPGRVQLAAWLQIGTRGHSPAQRVVRARLSDLPPARRLNQHGRAGTVDAPRSARSPPATD